MLDRFPELNILDSIEMYHANKRVDIKHYQLGFVLAGFRLLALVIGITTLTLSPLETYIIVPSISISIGLSIYSILRILAPFKWYLNKSFCAVMVGVDLLICILLIFITGGLYSPFLVYTLVPVLTVALFCDVRITSIIAVLTCLYNFIYHLLNHDFVNITDQLFLNHFLVYIAAVCLTSALPYIINANVWQRVRNSEARRERLIISREIHDGIFQDITYMRWQVQALQNTLKDAGINTSEIRETEKLAGKIQYDIRNALEIVGEYSDSGDIITRLKDCLKTIKINTNFDCSINGERSQIKMDPVVELELLRICQEALTNISKHSEAHAVSMSIKQMNEKLKVRIADDGCGFDTLYENKSNNKIGGHGLNIMKERAQSIGGNLSINSMPGTGTEVNIEVPITINGKKLTWLKR